MLNIIICFHFIFTIAISALAVDSIPAFPGAEGFGANAVGGRHGKVIKVTSLKDSGPGTLREAINDTAHRIVVFDVSGYIELDSSLEIRKPYITIAGQTAPGKGICIKNSDNSNQTSLEIFTHNVIIRYLRIRTGIGDPIVIPDSMKYNRYELDCISIYGKDNNRVITDCHDIIIDHCSFSWGSDENLSIIGTVDTTSKTNPRNISIQNCIISECLHYSSCPNGYASKGFLIAYGNVKNISVHHNLLAHNDYRNPQLQSNGCILDFVNNIIYNYGHYATILHNEHVPDQNMLVNYVRNYIKRGPNSKASIFEIYCGDNTSDNNYKGSRYKIYLESNIGPHTDESCGDVCIVKAANKSVKIDYLATKHNTPPVTTFPAEIAYNEVLKSAGAILPERDMVDERVIKDVREKRGSIINCVDNKNIELAEARVKGATIKTVTLDSNIHKSIYNNKYAGYFIRILRGTGKDQERKIISYKADNRRAKININWDTIPDSTSSTYCLICPCECIGCNAGGWPVYDMLKRDPDYDTDNDGMPGSWETQYGLNPNAPDDKLDLDNDGYTNIEEFLNRKDSL